MNRLISFCLGSIFLVGASGYAAPPVSVFLGIALFSVMPSLSSNSYSPNSSQCNELPKDEFSLSAFGACSSENQVNLVYAQTHDRDSTCSKMFVQFDNDKPFAVDFKFGLDPSFPLSVLCSERNSIAGFVPRLMHSNDLFPDYQFYFVNRNGTHSYRTIPLEQQFSEITPVLTPLESNTDNSEALVSWLPGNDEVLFRVVNPTQDYPIQRFFSEAVLGSNIEQTYYPAAICFKDESRNCIHFYTALRRGSGGSGIHAKLSVEDRPGQFLEGSPETDLNNFPGESQMNFINPRAVLIHEEPKRAIGVVFYQRALFGSLWAKVIEWHRGEGFKINRGMRISNGVGLYSISNLVNHRKIGVHITHSQYRRFSYRELKFDITKNGVRVAIIPRLKKKKLIYQNIPYSVPVVKERNPRQVTIVTDTDKSGPSAEVLRPKKRVYQFN